MPKSPSGVGQLQAAIKAGDANKIVKIYRDVCAEFAALNSVPSARSEQELHKFLRQKWDKSTLRSLDDILYGVEGEDTSQPQQWRISNYRRTVCQLWHVTAAEVMEKFNSNAREFWRQLSYFAAKVDFDTASHHVQEQARLRRIKSFSGDPPNFAPRDIALAAMELQVDLAVVSMTPATADSEGDDCDRVS